MSTVASPFALHRRSPSSPPQRQLPPPDGHHLVHRDAPVAIAHRDVSAGTTGSTSTPSTLTPSTLTPRAAVLVAICTAGALTAASLGATAWDAQVADAGAAAIPVVALAGMALAVIRRCPDHRVEPMRPVGLTLRIGLAIAAIALLVATIVLPGSRAELLGPALSVATVGSFLGLWGLRSPALLRSVAILGLLTWTWIANSCAGSTTAF